MRIHQWMVLVPAHRTLWWELDWNQTGTHLRRGLEWPQRGSRKELELEWSRIIHHQMRARDYFQNQSYWVRDLERQTIPPKVPG